MGLPRFWFLLVLRGLCGQNHAALQEIEACPSVALALDELEPVDLAFRLAATPWLHESSPNGSDCPPLIPRRTSHSQKPHRSGPS